MQTSLRRRFWDTKFPARKNLMSLINHVGWLCGILDKPVRYHGEHITTIQDYIKSFSVSTAVLNAHLNKVHIIKLDVPTNKKDSAKALRSTFAFFIHQKDASLACFVFEEAHRRGIPLYTVHHCFISPACYAVQLTSIYVDGFHSLTNPLHLVNCYIINNLFLRTATLIELKELYTWKPTNGLFRSYGSSHLGSVLFH